MQRYELSRNQVEWLKTHGGRDASDVEKDENGLFVCMSDGNWGEQRVYLPN